MTSQLIDVTARGVMPGAANCSDALDTLLATLPGKKAILYFPAGVYSLSRTLDLSGFPYLRLAGDGCKPGHGTQISGNFAGDLIRYADVTDCSLQCDIADIYFQNGGGNCLHVEGTVGSTFQRLRIDAGLIGINIPGNSFDTALRDIGFYGPGAAKSPNSVGLQAYLSNGNLSNLYAAGWGEGFRLCGNSIFAAGTRAEVNAIGWRLGVDSAGRKHILNNATILAGSLEANDVAILSVCIQGCEISGTIHGSTNAPSGQSQIAVLDRGSSMECIYKQLSTTGGFSTACYVLQDSPNYPTPAAPVNEWRWVTGENHLPGKSVWQIDPKAEACTLFHPLLPARS